MRGWVCLHREAWEGAWCTGAKSVSPEFPGLNLPKAALNRCFWKCIEIKWRKRSVVLYSECGGVEAFVNLLTTLDQVKWEPNKIPRPS